MWNYSFVLPSFMILSIFVGYYFSLPRLPIRRNYLFLFVLIVECLVFLSDLFATWADMNHQSFPYWALYALNSLYFILFFIRGFSFFIFTANILKIDFTKHKIGVFLLELPLNIGIILVLSTPWTKWYYYMDSEGYHNGPLYYYLYFVFGLYLIFSFCMLIANYTQVVKRREIYLVVFYNLILTAGIIARYALPKYLLMDIFCLMALIVLFLAFENPDIFLEERTFIFNRTALRQYVDEINGFKSINALSFGIRNYLDVLDLYGLKQINEGTYLIEDYIKKQFPKSLLFDYQNGRFVMFGDENTDWNKIYTTINERFSRPWISKDTELFLDVGATIINLEKKHYPSEVLFKLFTDSFLLANTTLENELAIIDNSTVEKINEEYDIKRALDFAIEKNSVEVFLQPIMDAKTQTLAGAEALARIRNLEGNLIPPGLFIPIAEKNGKINALGRQVFKKCCEFIMGNDLSKMNLSFLNVNLSPVQFMNSDLDEAFENCMKETGATANFIHLEITEESMIDEQLMEKQIHLLTDKGFKFVLDDYGKGYSNMSRLRKTPFINIKLDMSIVWDYCKNPDEILPNEVKCFSDSGFDITAEGIEDEYMAKKMTDIGCTYLQGYYFSKPLPINEFLEKYMPQ